MELNDLTKNEIKECFDNLKKYLSTYNDIKYERYVKLGSLIVKINIHGKEFLPHIEKQLTYILIENPQKYDVVLNVWKESDTFSLCKSISPKFDVKNNIKLRIAILYAKSEKYDIQVKDEKFSPIKPILDIQSKRGILIGNDFENNTYYYGVEDLTPEEFIKEGHIFVQFFNNMLKSENSNLVHGAVIGLNNKGILFCARGQRGKSTLSVLSMIRGFEYVSDDYLILTKTNNELISNPIYSIITLSPEMYNRLYSELEGSRFISNNARKDKYVFNISNFHNKFMKDYPIKLCIFPEITEDKEPSIRLCTKEEKGRAIVQIIQSTLMQMNDLSERQTVEKLINMVKDFNFYKFNLCFDIEKNTEYLKNFMNAYCDNSADNVDIDDILIDITFDLANIIDKNTGIIYSMNKFTTNILENLLNGVSIELLKSECVNFGANSEEYDILIDLLKQLGVLKQNIIHNNNLLSINKDFAQEDNYTILLTEHNKKGNKNLVKERKNDLLQIK